MVNVMYNKLSIGIDQSYARTGISIAADGKLKKIGSIDFKGDKNNTEKRQSLYATLKMIIVNNHRKAEEVVIVCEQVRLQSTSNKYGNKEGKAFINEPFIKSNAALVALIVDLAYDFNIKAYSVDTRSWKTQVVGHSKPIDNPYGIDPKKYPTIKYIESLGHLNALLIPYEGRGKKGVITIKGKRYKVNDDAADSAGMALYPFIPERLQKLNEIKI